MGTDIQTWKPDRLLKAILIWTVIICLCANF